jgi:hypothetical protein
MVRAALTTSARLTRDPVQPLQLADASLAAHGDDSGHTAPSR